MTQYRDEHVAALEQVSALERENLRLREQNAALRAQAPVTWRRRASRLPLILCVTFIVGGMVSFRPRGSGPAVAPTPRPPSPPVVQATPVPPSPIEVLYRGSYPDG